jgi:capsular polysaccharide biosynthesis protein
LAGGGMFYFTYNNYSQLYEATTTILTVPTGESSVNNSNSVRILSYNDILIGRQFEQDYQDIMMSEKVINDTVESLKAKNISYYEILNSISLNSQKDSNIIRITATHENPETSVLISNAVSHAFIARINEITKNNIFGVLSEAKLPLSPLETDLFKKTVLGLISGLIFALVIIYITELFDSRIRYIGDIECNTNLKVLASIPKYKTN